eukprot:CAMPEP_0179156506 /NCGR_PEP_ID=MMETSP0796-20121207/76300_1 /TAXON_ID=73915 /ORGANISM="Pyrodinium bahamense, Strain pbaha01" /LENGTH=444 /DNA_ID=CAMNT_0020858089 /DNA_START=35 /DNA_END=1369 /DNA_ORIENTATION=-
MAAVSGGDGMGLLLDTHVEVERPVASGDASDAVLVGSPLGSAPARRWPRTMPRWRRCALAGLLSAVALVALCPRDLALHLPEKAQAVTDEVADPENLLSLAAAVLGASSFPATSAAPQAGVMAVPAIPGSRAADMLGSLGVAEFFPYYNYQGPLKVSGTLQVAPSGATSQALSWHLEGVDANCGCLDHSGVARACSIAIHAGMDCEKDALGFLAAAGLDPWGDVSYVTQTGTSAVGGTTVTMGLALDRLIGHAVVVRDLVGTPVACGLLQRLPGVAAGAAPPSAGPKRVLTGDEPWRQGLLVTEFVPFAGYVGPFKHVWGTIKVVSNDAGDGSQFMQWFLHGVDANCGHANTAGISDACGVHIHTATSCSAATGSRYFRVATDPWDPAAYAITHDPEECLTPGAGEGLNMITGLTEADVIGHAVVVHDASGVPIACGLLHAAAN